MKQTMKRTLPTGMQARIDAADKVLDACPFTLCDHHGGVVIDWEQHPLPGKVVPITIYFAFCNACNASGPRFSTPEQAAEVWNERDPTKQVDWSVG